MGQSGIFTLEQKEQVTAVYQLALYDPLSTDPSEMVVIATGGESDLPRFQKAIEYYNQRTGRRKRLHHLLGIFRPDS